MEESESFRILLLHDGDLDFVGALLREFGVCFEERRGAATEADRESNWNLVVASATRIMELPAKRKGRRIAILSEDSRTLRSMLRRLRVDLMVRRPVHPAAFRLLLLHSLYNGPERRHTARASVGGPVRIRIGLRKHESVLLDISRTGCRVLSEVAVTRRMRLKVCIPPELAGDKKLVLKGSTARTEKMKTADGVKQAIGIAFESLSPAKQKRLFQIVAQHRSGPAMMPARGQPGTAVAPEQSVGQPVSTTSISPSRPRRAAASQSGRPSASAVDDSEEQRSGMERRQDTRRDFDRRVIVLGEEAARVLLGRDLAARGMRVESDGSLAIGDGLRIALHVRSGEVPLVVSARVLRDDGERGTVLGFENLSDSDKNYLEKMVGTLPVLSGDEGEGDDSDAGSSGVVVTEILERT